MNKVIKVPEDINNDKNYKWLSEQYPDHLLIKSAEEPTYQDVKEKFGIWDTYHQISQDYWLLTNTPKTVGQPI